MTTATLATPQEVEARLGEIENDLAELQNDLEDAAVTWFTTKRTREKEWARRFIAATGTVAERSAIADRDSAEEGKEHEAAYEALKAKARVLDTRAAIGMSLLRAQSRVGG